MKIPEIENPENWWWRERENQKEEPEPEPSSTTIPAPRNVLISSLLEEIQMQETAQTAVSGTIGRVHDVSQPGQEIYHPIIPQPTHDVPHQGNVLQPPPPKMYPSLALRRGSQVWL